MAPAALTAEDVLLVHDVLVRDFSQSGDPVLPPGLRDRSLLESAIGRQHVSFAGKDKYTSPLECAATLTYGICNNHAFHNGNKRTALVSMLAHLDKNGLTLTAVPQAELYEMIIALADHRIGRFVHGKKAVPKPTADDDVAALAYWLSKRVKKPRRGEKQITYRELRKILHRFGYDLRVPVGGRGNLRDVIKIETRAVGLFRRRVETSEKRIGTTGYRDEGTFLALGDIKKVRQLCRLREEDGVDSDAFYDDEAVIDAFINRYRTILRRLARK